MTPPTQPPNLHDDRWGGYIPWFLRHPDFAVLGQFHIFFDRVAHRLKQVVNRGEAGDNQTDLGDTIESESHQCFRFNPDRSLAEQLQNFFAPTQIAEESLKLADTDPVVIEARDVYLKAERLARPSPAASLGLDISKRTQREASFKLALTQLAKIRGSRVKFHYHGSLLQRLTVLECVLRLIKAARTPAFSSLRELLRRYLAEAQIMLDIAEEDGKIIPMEEPLLQKEVIDRLLPRLATRFPQQEKDLVKAYHDLIQGVDANTIFGNAFKALEEIARQITGQATLELRKEKDLQKHFPLLHPIVHATIAKLAAHRGDKGAHGRQGPPVHEMRYLLFSICNVALLFLDYPSPTTPASA